MEGWSGGQHGYRYKNIVQVGVLGQIDDLIGVTEAGFRAQELNSFINTKSAEKRLQFNESKCKTILVGKKIEHFHKKPLVC